MGRGVDLQQVEVQIRSALTVIGATALRAVMQEEVDRLDTQRQTPPDMEREGRRPVWVRSFWGDFVLYRAYYTRKNGGEGMAPADDQLGLWQSYTPLLAQTLVKLSAMLPFEPAAELLHETVGTAVNGRQFHRLTAEVAAEARKWKAALAPASESHDTMYVSFDGTGVPMRKYELMGRKGRNGPAKTREMRLGCVFTQTATDPEGHPVRDPHSTTYIAGLAPSMSFGRAVRAEAIRRGMKNTRRVVVLSDGANWCEKVAALRFPGRTHILDFFHAAEHIQALSLALFAEGDLATEHFETWRHQLHEGGADTVLAQANDLLPQAKTPEAARREIAYLTHNLPRMQYALYRQQGLFIGSGVIEAGCKTVIAQRTKASGMLWSKRGVEDVLTLRCLVLGGQLTQFWEDSRKARRAA